MINEREQALKDLNASMEQLRKEKDANIADLTKKMDEQRSSFEKNIDELKITIETQDKVILVLKSNVTSLEEDLYKKKDVEKQLDENL